MAPRARLRFHAGTNRAVAPGSARVFPGRSGERPASPSLRRMTPSAITSLSTSTPSQSNITSSGQRELRIKFANLPLGSPQDLCRPGAFVRGTQRSARPPASLRPARSPTSPTSRTPWSAPRRGSADHRGAQKHRLQGLRRFDRLAAHIGDDLADQCAPRRAATDDNRVEFVADSSSLRTMSARP